MDCPVLFEVDHDSILLGWSAPVGALEYELQMTAGEEEEWRTLSASIKSTSIRKKNLVSETPYKFRIRCRFASGWDVYLAPTPALLIVPCNQYLLTITRTPYQYTWERIFAFFFGYHDCLFN
jgi:hypothetical protein